ncbi:hypothetical protein TNCV_1524191 [Trichonephila clavipes]|nr:hypothetical protein TNCV_1524191 [Trichonephila clavipes]
MKIGAFIVWENTFSTDKLTPFIDYFVDQWMENTNMPIKSISPPPSVSSYLARFGSRGISLNSLTLFPLFVFLLCLESFYYPPPTNAPCPGLTTIHKDLACAYLKGHLTGRAKEWYEVIGYALVQGDGNDFVQLKQALKDSLPVVRNKAELEARF